MGRLTDLVLRPMGVPATLSAIAASLLSIWAARVPGIEESLPLLASVILWLFLLIRWALFLIATLLYSARVTGKLFAFAGSTPLALTAIPFALILVYLIGLTGVPMDIAFRLSERQLESFAQQAMQSPVGTTQNIDRWIGLFYVEQSVRLDDGFRITIPASSGLIFNRGFAYFPNGAPISTNPPWAEYTHYQGPWYISLHYGG